MDVVLFAHGTLSKVKGTFRHARCSRFSMTSQPFERFTCSQCATITVQDDFRMRVVREEKSLEKRGLRGTGDGCRLSYLATTELLHIVGLLKNNSEFRGCI